jgi:4a-hydroxytetrahydrobiopterin dehydratase
MNDLAKKTCIPCQGGVPALPKDKCLELMKNLDGWTIDDNAKRLIKIFKFDDFKKAIGLAVLIGEMSDEQWHHPELHVGFGHLDIEVWTHKIDGLVESDFIFCAKVDEICREYLS